MHSHIAAHELVQSASNQRWTISKGRERPSAWLYPSLPLCVQNPSVSTTRTVAWEHVPGAWLAPWTPALSPGWLSKAWAQCSGVLALCAAPKVSWFLTQPHIHELSCMWPRAVNTATKTLCLFAECLCVWLCCLFAAFLNGLCCNISGNVENEKVKNGENVQGKCDYSQYIIMKWFAFPFLNTSITVLAFSSKKQLSVWRVQGCIMPIGT